MTETPQQHNDRGLRNTLPVVFERKALIAERFYQAMFRLAPDTRAFFRTGFGRQKSVFAMLIVKIAQSADNPAAMEKIARDLVAVHRARGITPDQYRIAGIALDEALTANLSDRLSGPELARWTQVADTLVQRMIELAGQTDMQTYFISRNSSMP